VAAYGYFGMGNIGNEGSLEAFLRYMRRTHPEAALSCFAAGPGEVEREHGVPATQLMAYRAAPDTHGPVTTAVKALSRLWDIPRTFRLMRDVDVLVVPGTGVLETKLVSTPWGLPYWLFLASLSCRLRRRKVALVSVGAEYATHPVTRRLYRWTVALSHYCSFRDEESREAARAMGVRGRLGKVFPDLAFALPTPQDRAERPGHVVIGVMAYDGAAPDIQNKDYLTTAGSIVQVEARHAAVIRALMDPNSNPVPNAFEGTLTPPQVLDKVSPILGPEQ